MKENLLMTRAYDFALRVVNFYRFLVERRREFVLSKQLLRSATSIGANVAESTRAESRADFVHKLSIALKESFETEYWLRILRDAGFVDAARINGLIDDCKEIQRILTASVKTAKSRR